MTYVVNEIENLDKQEGKAYEIGYLLSPLISVEKLPEMVISLIRSAIESAGGLVTAEQTPKMITLAYPIGKMINNKNKLYKEAYFGAIRFEADGSVIEAIKERLDQGAEVVRYLIMTISADAQPLGAQRGPASRPYRLNDPEVEEDSPVKEIEEKPEMTEADIDKEIEDLLVPNA